MCHPEDEQFRDHMVNRGIPVRDFICGIHKEVLQYSCQTCDRKKCPDCLFLTKQCSNHKVEKVSEYLKRRKANVKFRVNEDTTQCNEESDKLMEAIWQQEENLKMMSLVQRERIGQEFASVRDLLCERETNLYNQMDQCLVKSLKKLSTLRVQCGKMVETSAKLSSLMLDILAEPSSSKALKEIEGLEFKIQQSEKTRRKVSGVDVTKFTVSDFTLSLYKEKSHLLHSTNIEKLDTQDLVSVRCHTMYIAEDRLSRPVPASEFLFVRHPLPPSTSCIIAFQIRYTQERRELTSLDDVVLNAPGGSSLYCGQRYLLKFDVRVVTQTSAFGDRVDTKTFHILVVTAGTGMETNTSIKRKLWENIKCHPLYRAQNRLPLFVISFEEERRKMQIRKEMESKIWRRRGTPRKLTSEETIHFNVIEDKY